MLLVYAFFLTFFLQLFPAAQLPRAVSANQDASSSSSQRREPSTPDSHQEEFMERAIIKGLEASHKETLESAKEGADLGASLRAAYEKSKSLSRDDLKKLERMEKLVRRIRSKVGGSDDESVLEKPPPNLEAALAQLSELSEELRQSVEKTSRHVISAAVIESSNELLQLIRHVRSVPR
jgi:hypothetical protein